MATRKRKAGGQPGNANALKHGFYSRKFLELESQDLDQVRAGLIDEIAMLRVTIRRVFDHASDLGEVLDGLRQELREGGSPEAFARLNVLSQSLSTLGIATTRLAHMLRTQKFLDGGSDDPLEELVLQAIESIGHGA